MMQKRGDEIPPVKADASTIDDDKSVMLAKWAEDDETRPEAIQIQSCLQV